MEKHKIRHHRLRSQGTLRKIASLFQAIRSFQAQKNLYLRPFNDNHSSLSIRICYDKIKVVIHQVAPVKLRTKPLRKNDCNYYQPDLRRHSQNLFGKPSLGLSPPDRTHFRISASFNEIFKNIPLYMIT